MKNVTLYVASIKLMRIQCATFNSHALGVYFDSLHFDVLLFHTDLGDENGIIKLPTAWSISQKTAQLGIKIILHQVSTLIDDDSTKNLVIKKYIVIEDWSGCMQYYAHGKNVNADQTLLANILNDVSALPAVLAKFERMRVCTGIGSVGTFLIKGEAFKDYSLSWHHNECTLITKKKKCESCKTLKKTLWQRQHRCAKQGTGRKISRVLDDQS